MPPLIGRYRVLSTLGTGGFATVYLAEDPRLDVTVAIKMLSADRANQADIRSRFIEEARVMRRLAAPGLVVIHDIDEHDDKPYFVMEHCERGTLKERLDSLARPINLAEARGLAQALTTATAGIHKAGVVHRDLKPSNYLIRHTPTQSRPGIGELFAPDEELVVADFGLAKTLNVDASRLTLAGGTPGFSAPEQFRGDPSINTRADVYALSAMLIAALSGKAPRTVLSADDQAFSTRALRAAGPLRASLTQGLAFDPGNRQANAMQWHEALTQLPATSATISAQPEAERIFSQGHTFSRRAMLRTGAVAVLGLAGTSALAASPVRLPGPRIIGPSEGFVGDEAVFAVEDLEPMIWTVNGRQQPEAQVISISPDTPGTYTIKVATTWRSTTHAYIVTQPQTGLRIEGPGYALVNQATQFTAIGTEPDDATWTINQKTSTGVDVNLKPARIGTVTMTLTTDTSATTRTITAIKTTP